MNSTITTAAVVTTAGLFAGGYAYAALSAQSQIFGKVLTGLNRQILGKDAAVPTFNVEDSVSLDKTLSALTQ